jgi:hypothetical protein
MSASHSTAGRGGMTVNEGLRAVAGFFVLLSVALGTWVSPWFFAFTAFVGLNLLQSAFTRWCPMMWVLGKAGCPRD